MCRKPALITIIVLLAACTALLPAGATPPRAITVGDVLFGVSKTHLFLLRSIRDNLETRGTTLTDIMLVAKAFDTGAETKAWPVRRILATGDPFVSRAPGKVRDLTTTGVNPFDILATHNGYPLTDDAARRPRNALLQHWSTDGVLAIGRWSNAAEYELGRNPLAAQLASSLVTARRALPAFQEGHDPLLQAAFARSGDCHTGKLYLAPLPDRLAAFARLDCLDSVEMVEISIYVAVPAVETD